ncbi:MAG: metallophosphatase domain-containing protein [Muribaculaceae bacterium]|nr:metallophosphatase domain-containing protein [Muribaculaceae bacterium]
MRILHISDTHNCHHQLRDLPEADVIVHSGDFTLNGSEAEAIDFIEWFCNLPYRHKIFISGNHDECMYGADIIGLDSNVHYLCNSGIELEGVNFYGVPMFLKNYIADNQLEDYRRIPCYTDVLITHSPPYGILDSDGGVNYGSEELLLNVTGIEHPRLHLFGHIHNQHGIMIVNDTIFSNGSIINENGTIMKTPHILEI